METPNDPTIAEAVRDSLAELTVAGCDLRAPRALRELANWLEALHAADHLAPAARAEQLERAINEALSSIEADDYDTDAERILHLILRD